MSGDRPNDQSCRNSRLETALELAKNGFSVFPLHTVINGDCSCGKKDCGPKGKHPRLKGGFKVATRDVQTITGWFSRWPEANIGIATGKASGIFVVDEDPRHGGDKTIQALEEKYGPLDTVTCNTGGGGRHFYFNLPKDVKL